MSSRRPFGTVKQRTDRPGWYVVFRHPSRPKPIERKAGPTKRIASERLAIIEALVAKNVPLGEILAEVFGEFHGSTLTFRDAVSLYLEDARQRLRPSTLKTHNYRLDLLSKAPWAGEYLAKVTTAALTRWARDRRKGGASRPTVNRDLNVGSAVFGWAIREEYVERNPFAGVERFSEAGRTRRVHLTSSEATALVRVTSAPLRPFVVTALLTGMRRGELLALKWRSVDLNSRMLTVEPQTDKGGTGRRVPMAVTLVNVLARLKAQRTRPRVRGSDSVFLGDDGRPLTIKTIRYGFRAAVDRCEEIPRAKRDKVTLHCLRHTAVSLMVAKRVPIADIAHAVGHKHISTTMRYAHAQEESVRSALDRLEDALPGLDDEDDAASAVAS